MGLPRADPTQTVQRIVAQLQAQINELRNRFNDLAWSQLKGRPTALNQPHNLLSANHWDTLTKSVARGDLLTGNTALKWDVLAIGSAGSLLTSDGIDASWGTTLAKSAAHRSTTDFITLSNTNPTNETCLGTAIGIVAKLNDVAASEELGRLEFAAIDEWAGSANHYSEALLKPNSAGKTEAIGINSRYGFELYGSSIWSDEQIAAWKIGDYSPNPASLRFRQEFINAMHYYGFTVQTNSHLQSVDDDIGGSFDVDKYNSSPEATEAIADDAIIYKWLNAQGERLRLSGNGDVTATSGYDTTVPKLTLSNLSDTASTTLTTIADTIGTTATLRTTGTAAPKIVLEAGDNGQLDLEDDGTIIVWGYDNITSMEKKKIGRISDNASAATDLRIAALRNDLILKSDSGHVVVSPLTADTTLNSVVTQDSGALHSRTIDSRVWGSSLIDGTGTAGKLPKFSDSNTQADSLFSCDTLGGTVDGTFKTTGAFGCNNATPQTAYASGGALSAYSTGSAGFDTYGQLEELYNLVVAIRAALVANGIMS